MQHSPDQIDKIKTTFARMKFCFILLMFMCVAIYIYADRYQDSNTHNYWLGLIIFISVISSIGYLYYLVHLVKHLEGNPLMWVLLTIIFGPFGLLLSYTVISGKVLKLQRQQIVDLQRDKEE